MIEAYFRATKDSAIKNLHTLQEIESCYQQAGADPDHSRMLWVNVQAPSAEEMDWLTLNFQLHPMVVEDISERDQRSKLEEYYEYLFMVLHRPVVTPNQTELSWEELHIILNKNWMITVLDKNPVELKTSIQKISENQDLLKRGIGAVLYHLCDDVVSAYFPIIDSFAENMEDMEEEAIRTPGQSLLDRMFRLKRNLVEMRRYLAPQRDVFRILLDRSDTLFDKHARPYFRDVYDHTVRVYDMLDSLRDQVANGTDLYLSVVNNNMNQVMKRLTVITTIFMPITFVTGVFGMNFGHMPQVEFDPGWLWWVCIIGMALIAGFTYWSLRRMRLV